MTVLILFVEQSSGRTHLDTLGEDSGLEEGELGEENKEPDVEEEPKEGQRFLVSHCT